MLYDIIVDITLSEVVGKGGRVKWEGMPLVHPWVLHDIIYLDPPVWIAD